MSSSDKSPKWWQLYLTFPLLIALFAVDNRLKLSMRSHQVVQFGIILLIYGFVHVWLKTNSSALSRIDQRQFRRAVIVTRVPAYRLPESSFQLPDSEIKGILSDTYQMDYIDADSFPMEEISQELNKEEK